MGVKLLWTGLTLILAGGLIPLPVPAIEVVGAVIMVFGLVLFLLDK